MRTVEFAVFVACGLTAGCRASEPPGKSSGSPILAPTGAVAPLLPKGEEVGRPSDLTSAAPLGSIPTAALRFLIIGGGPVPEHNEVSVEQDVELVQKALPGPGMTLFAGGNNATVRVLATDPGPESVRVALGALFAPRPGRDSRYRAPRFKADAATLEHVEQALDGALGANPEPLLVYLAGHGDQGDTPKKNSIALWGGKALSVEALAALHQAHPRGMRLVVTSCFSGGFAELAFANADADALQPSSVMRCGVFAGTADRETSGCDPNPSRRAQESYGLHLTHALSGERKDGTRLDTHELDYDADGEIGLLDAHTWARIQAVSLDLPTTTSERWLRAVERDSSAVRPGQLPEEVALTRRLGSRLGVDTEEAARQRWEELDSELATLDARLAQVEVELSAAEDALATRLLERWPVIDDPFHPDFEATFAQNEGAIGVELFESDTAKKRRALASTTDHLYARYDRLLVLEARILRVLRAYETLHLASALQRRGGPNAHYYEELLRCERASVGVGRPLTVE